MSKYRKGADLERQLVRLLRERGWEAARSASSKSAVDVWAIRDGDLKLFQCAVNRTAAKERAVAEATDRLGFQVCLATRHTIRELAA